MNVEVLKRKEVLPGYKLVRMDAPDIARNARPGQFLHIRCSDTMDPLLRRPISIHSVDRDKGTVSILYRVAGRGTARLGAFDRLDVMGPLGKGFKLPAPNSKVLVAGGGIGTAPLYFLLQEMSALGLYVDVFLGAASSAHLLLVHEIKDLGHRVQVATEDGSAGHHGLVTGICSPAVISGMDEVFACGPRPMLRALAKILADNNVPGQFSMEERMGCGIGACLACACKTLKDNPEGFTFSHVCVDGPVFSAGEVVWE